MKSVRKVIEEIFDSEVSELPRYKKMRKGQREKMRGSFLEWMIKDLAGTMLSTEDGNLKLSIAKMFADYSGQRPSLTLGITAGDNPYDGLSLEEIRREKEKLLGHTEVKSVEGSGREERLLGVFETNESRFLPGGEVALESDSEEPSSVCGREVDVDGGEMGRECSGKG